MTRKLYGIESGGASGNDPVESRPTRTMANALVGEGVNAGIGVGVVGGGRGWRGYGWCHTPLVTIPSQWNKRYFPDSEIAVIGQVNMSGLVHSNPPVPCNRRLESVSTIAAVTWLACTSYHGLRAGSRIDADHLS